MNKVNLDLEKEQQDRGFHAVCGWIKKNRLLIIITIFFIGTDTLSKIWMQTDDINIGALGAFMSSLATAGFAYIVAGFTKS